MCSVLWYSQLAMVFNTWQVVEEWAKYCTNWLCSMYTWRYNNDVIFIKISIYRTCPIKLRTKPIFGVFIFWKITELCHFVTYLWNDPCRVTESWSFNTIQHRFYKTVPGEFLSEILHWRQFHCVTDTMISLLGNHQKPLGCNVQNDSIFDKSLIW